MGKPSQRRLERKRRKEKQERRRRQERDSEPLAYRGNKYRTEELIPLHLETETAIYECFVMEKRRLTDHDVRRAIATLIGQLRSGTARPPQAGQWSARDPAAPEQLILWNILGHWEHYFHENPRPGRDGLVGVLRSILGSIEVWGNINPQSRGYLEYLEGFLGKLGVNVQVFSSREELEAAGIEVPDLPALLAPDSPEPIEHVLQQQCRAKGDRIGRE